LADKGYDISLAEVEIALDEARDSAVDGADPTGRITHFARLVRGFSALRSAPSSSRCQRDMSLRISLTLHFRAPDAQVPPQWP
jgi:hypothetical protein